MRYLIELSAVKEFVSKIVKCLIELRVVKEFVSRIARYFI